jgi:hypothetical protein
MKLNVLSIKIASLKSQGVCLEDELIASKPPDSDSTVTAVWKYGKSYGDEDSIKYSR